MNKKYSNKQLIEILKTKAKELNRTPTRREVYQNQIISIRFGSWNEAIEKAGLKLLKREYSQSELIDIAKRFYKKNKKSPKIADYNDNIYLPAATTVMKKFGSWNDYLLSADLPTNIIINKISSTKDEILEEFKKEFLRINAASSYDYNKRRNKHLLSVSSLEEVFECTWNKILNLAELPIFIDRYTDEKLLSELKTLADRLNRTPSSSDFTSSCKISGRNIRRRFGSWNKALKKAGLFPSHLTPETVKETDIQLLKMYVKFSKRIGEKTNGATGVDLDSSKDIYNSDVFVTRFGSMNELRQKVGFTQIIRSSKKYTKKQLLIELRELYKKNNGRLKVKELSKKSTTCATTILRYFHTTKMEKVWVEVEKTLGKTNEKY